MCSAEVPIPSGSKWPDGPHVGRETRARGCGRRDTLVAEAGAHVGASFRSSHVGRDARAPPYVGVNFARDCRGTRVAEAGAHVGACSIMPKRPARVRLAERLGEHSLKYAMNFAVRARRSSSEVKLARLSRRPARMENQISTWFSHEQWRGV